MKKLKLKLEELTNPTILTHHEIKNIFGGSGGGDGICLNGDNKCKKWNSGTLQFDYGACSGTGTMADPCTCSLGIGATSCVAPIMG